MSNLKTTWVKDFYNQKELLGFSLCDHFKLVQEEFLENIKAKDMILHINKIVIFYGVLVNTRFYKSANGKLMRFCTFTDCEGNYFDMVHFSQVVEKYPINGLGVYACCGKVFEEFDFCSNDILWTKKFLSFLILVV